MAENNRRKAIERLRTQMGELRADLVETEVRIEALSTRAESFCKARLQHLAGSDYDAIAVGPSSEKLRWFLQHPDPGRRCAALAVVCGSRRFDVADCVAGMCVSDGGGTVRSWAISALSVLYSGTNDSQAGATLAQIVGNGAEHESLRASAYVGLLLIAGQRVPACYFESDRLPSDVDWGLVARFAGREC